MASPSKRKRGRPKGRSPKKSTKRAETDDGERSAEGDGSLSLEPPERVLVIFCSKCNTIFGDTNSFVCTHDGLKTITLRSECPQPARFRSIRSPSPRARAFSRAVTDVLLSLSLSLLCLPVGTLAENSRVHGENETGSGGDADGGHHGGKVSCRARSLARVSFRSDSLLTRSSSSSSSLSLPSTFYPVHCDSCSQCVGKVFLSTTRSLDPMRDAFTFDSQAVKSYELTESPNGGGRAVAANGNGPSPLAAWTDRLDVLETQVLKVENLMLLFNERIDALEAASGHHQGLR